MSTRKTTAERERADYVESVRRLAAPYTVAMAQAGQAFEDILHTVWECERFEREHPLTVATIRSLAPRS